MYVDDANVFKNKSFGNIEDNHDNADHNDVNVMEAGPEEDPEESLKENPDGKPRDNLRDQNG